LVLARLSPYLPAHRDWRSDKVRYPSVAPRRSAESTLARMALCALLPGSRPTPTAVRRKCDTYLRRSGEGRSPGLGAWRSALLPGSRDLRPLLFGENAIPIFVAPAKAGVQAWAHGALRFCLDPATYAHCCPEKMRYLSSSLRRRPESRLG